MSNQILACISVLVVFGLLGVLSWSSFKASERLQRANDERHAALLKEIEDLTAQLTARRVTDKPVEDSPIASIPTTGRIYLGRAH